MGALVMVAPAVGRVSPGVGQPGQGWDQRADDAGNCMADAVIRWPPVLLCDVEAV